MINVKNFKDLLMVPDMQLLRSLPSMLKEYSDIAYCDNYLYAKGKLPVMLVAHVDTIHKTKPHKIYYDYDENVIWSPDGCGGDDRCGVYSILQIIKHFKPHVLFTNYEETGGIGARMFSKTHNCPNDLSYIIELDRRGNQNAVYYDCGNKAFKGYINSFGFTTHYGTFSDISIISPQWDIASVNLSIGYYREHTHEEYINLNHMSDTIDKVVKILERPNTTRYDFQESFNGYYNGQAYTYGIETLPEARYFVPSRSTWTGYSSR
jgi:hypothetical protein